MISRTKALRLRALIEQAAVSLDDEYALEGVELFPGWKVGKAYEQSERVRYNDTLYRCVQAHTSQSDWTPDVTPALWVVVSLDEYPEWVQPTGAHDAYHKGDKVSYTQKHWVSDVDNNTWAPGVYGWSEVV